MQSCTFSNAQSRASAMEASFLAPTIPTYAPIDIVPSEVEPISVNALIWLGFLGFQA